MAVHFELPGELERALREAVDDLDQLAKEAALIEVYRQDKLTQYQLAQALGISRLQVQAILKRHDVTEDLPTEREIGSELPTLRRLLQS